MADKNQGSGTAKDIQSAIDLVFSTHSDDRNNFKNSLLKNLSIDPKTVSDESIIYSAYTFFVIVVCDTDNYIQFARPLVDHTNVYAAVGKCFKKRRRGTGTPRHSVADRGYYRNILNDVYIIGTDVFPYFIYNIVKHSAF